MEMKSSDNQTKPQKPGLMVTISHNPKKNYKNWLICAGIEHFGIHLEDRVVKPTNTETTFLFEKLSDGEAFFGIFEHTKLKAIKQEL